MELLRQKNPQAAIVTTPWDQLTGEQIIAALEGQASLAAELAKLQQAHQEHHHHHDHDEHCTCGCHDHEHRHHHADEVFTSWGVETARKFTKASIEAALHSLDTGRYGMVLRAKGILMAQDGGWIHFDYVPEEHNIRSGGADITGKLCVIGAQLDEKGVAALFGV